MDEEIQSLEYSCDLYRVIHFPNIEATRQKFSYTPLELLFPIPQCTSALVCLRLQAFK